MLCYKYITLKFRKQEFMCQCGNYLKNFFNKYLASQTTKKFFEAMHRIWFG